jgi:hypothetical protein
VRETIDVGEYCDALLTWARVASRPDLEAVLRAGCDFIRAKHTGKASIRILCAEMTSWAFALPELQLVGGLTVDIRKSCLLFRLIYAGESLRTRRCPIHEGRRSGCALEPCTAGCSFGSNITGWLPENSPA